MRFPQQGTASNQDAHRQSPSKNKSQIDLKLLLKLSKRSKIEPDAVYIAVRITKRNVQFD